MQVIAIVLYIAIALVQLAAIISAMVDWTGLA